MARRVTRGIEPISPDPVSVRSSDYLPAYLSNGLIGLRVREVPLRPGVATVSGLSGIDRYNTSNRFRSCRIRSRQTYESDPYGWVTWSTRSLLGSSATTSRAAKPTVTWKPCATIDGSCWMPSPSAAARNRRWFARRSRFGVDGACALALRAQIEDFGVPGRLLERSVPVPGDGIEVDGALRWETSGASRSVGWRMPPSSSARPASSGNAPSTPATSRCRRLTRYHDDVGARTGFDRSSRSWEAQPPPTGPGGGSACRTRSPDRIRRTSPRQRDRVGELWRGRPVLIGAETRWQALADAAFFYLNSSVHASSVSSTHIFGLARWHDYHYYYGHVMWDIEVFGLPCLLFVQPHAARAMLDYRMRSVPAARLNAQLNGYRGLQFPWQSGPREGEEAAPGEGDAAMYEHHVGPAVAKAFVRYGNATGDRRFVARLCRPSARRSRDMDRKPRHEERARVRNSRRNGYCRAQRAF